MTYDTVDTPYGKLLLVAGPNGLRRVAFESEGFDEVLASMGGDAEPGSLDDIRTQLEEYFEGKRSRFDIELDLDGIGGFRRRALGVMAAVPDSEPRTHREPAAGAGNPDP